MPIAFRFRILAATGAISLKQTLYLMPTYSWLLALVGGLMFGYGMGLTNGCGARALVLLSPGIAAYMTFTGVLAPLRTW